MALEAPSPPSVELSDCVSSDEVAEDAAGEKNAVAAGEKGSTTPVENSSKRRNGAPTWDVEPSDEFPDDYITPQTETVALNRRPTFKPFAVPKKNLRQALEGYILLYADDPALKAELEYHHNEIKRGFMPDTTKLRENFAALSSIVLYLRTLEASCKNLKLRIRPKIIDDRVVWNSEPPHTRKIVLPPEQSTEEVDQSSSGVLDEGEPTTEDLPDSWVPLVFEEAVAPTPEEVLKRAEAQLAKDIDVTEAFQIKEQERERKRDEEQREKDKRLRKKEKVHQKRVEAKQKLREKEKERACREIGASPAIGEDTEREKGKEGTHSKKSEHCHKADKDYRVIREKTTGSDVEQLAEEKAAKDKNKTEAARLEEAAKKTTRAEGAAPGAMAGTAPEEITAREKCDIRATKAAKGEEKCATEEQAAEAANNFQETSAADEKAIPAAKAAKRAEEESAVDGKAVAAAKTTEGVEEKRSAEEETTAETKVTEEAEEESAADEGATAAANATQEAEKESGADEEAIAEGKTVLEAEEKRGAEEKPLAEAKRAAEEEAAAEERATQEAEEKKAAEEEAKAAAEAAEAAQKAEERMAAKAEAANEAEEKRAVEKKKVAATEAAQEAEEKKAAEEQAMVAVEAAHVAEEKWASQAESAREAEDKRATAAEAAHEAKEKRAAEEKKTAIAEAAQPAEEEKGAEVEAAREAKEERAAEVEAAREAEGERLAEAETVREAEEKRVGDAEAAQKAEVKRAAEAEVARKAEEKWATLEKRASEAEGAQEAEEQRAAEADSAQKVEEERAAEAEAAQEAEEERVAESEALQKAGENRATEEKRALEAHAAHEAEEKRAAEAEAAQKAEEKTAAEMEAAREAEQKMEAEAEALQEVKEKVVAEREAAQKAEEKKAAETEAARKAEEKREAEGKRTAEAEAARKAEEKRAAKAEAMTAVKAAHEAEEKRVAEEAAMAAAKTAREAAEIKTAEGTALAGIDTAAKITRSVERETDSKSAKMSNRAPIQHTQCAEDIEASSSANVLSARRDLSVASQNSPVPFLTKRHYARKRCAPQTSTPNSNKRRCTGTAALTLEKRRIDVEKNITAFPLHELPRKRQRIDWSQKCAHRRDGVDAIRQNGESSDSVSAVRAERTHRDDDVPAWYAERKKEDDCQTSSTEEEKRSFTKADTERENNRTARSDSDNESSSLAASSSMERIMDFRKMRLIPTSVASVRQRRRHFEKVYVLSGNSYRSNAGFTCCHLDPMHRLLVSLDFIEQYVPQDNPVVGYAINWQHRNIQCEKYKECNMFEALFDTPCGISYDRAMDITEFHRNAVIEIKDHMGVLFDGAGTDDLALERLTVDKVAKAQEIATMMDVKANIRSIAMSFHARMSDDDIPWLGCEIYRRPEGEPVTMPNPRIDDYAFDIAQMCKRGGFKVVFLVCDAADRQMLARSPRLADVRQVYYPKPGNCSQVEKYEADMAEMIVFGHHCAFQMVSYSPFAFASLALGRKEIWMEKTFCAFPCAERSLQAARARVAEPGDTIVAARSTEHHSKLQHLQRAGWFGWYHATVMSGKSAPDFVDVKYQEKDSTGSKGQERGLAKKWTRALWTTEDVNRHWLRVDAEMRAMGSAHAQRQHMVQPLALGQPQEQQSAPGRRSSRAASRTLERRATEPSSLPLPIKQRHTLGQRTSRTEASNVQRRVSPALSLPYPIAERRVLERRVSAPSALPYPLTERRTLERQARAASSLPQPIAEDRPLRRTSSASALQQPDRRRRRLTTASALSQTMTEDRQRRGPTAASSLPQPSTEHCLQRRAAATSTLLERMTEDRAPERHAFCPDSIISECRTSATPSFPHQMMERRTARMASLSEMPTAVASSLPQAIRAPNPDTSAPSAASASALSPSTPRSVSLLARRPSSPQVGPIHSGHHASGHVTPHVRSTPVVMNTPKRTAAIRMSANRTRRVRQDTKR